MSRCRLLLKNEALFEKMEAVFEKKEAVFKKNEALFEKRWWGNEKSRRSVVKKPPTWLLLYGNFVDALLVASAFEVGGKKLV